MIITDKNYDNWKLDSKCDDVEECEHCEVVGMELNEVQYYDADRDLQTLWLCCNCEEGEIWI